MKISVLTPSFNSGKYLERAILSVLDQDYSIVEHIIVDGGSNDSTLEILNKYKNLIWISEKDNGQSDAMNKAFKMSTGDIIVYLNADDYFEPNVFGSVINQFREHDVDMVVGNFYNRYFDGSPEELIKPVTAFNKILFPQRFNFPQNPVSYFYKRRVQEKIGKFPDDEHFAMDYWFLLRVFAFFKIIKIEIPLGTFYRTGLNKTFNNESTGANIKRMARSFISNYAVSKRIKYFITNYYYDLWHAMKYQYWKIPFKYFYYLLFAKGSYTSFAQFNKVGLKQHRSTQ